MVTKEQRVAPDEFILSVLSAEDRLDVAFKIARQAFKGTSLTLEDIQGAVTKIRKKKHGKKTGRS